MNSSIRYFMIEIKKKNQKGGTAILLVLLIMSSFLVVTLAMSDLVINGFRMDKTQLESTKSYFAAEAGAERILYEIRKLGFDVTIGPCVNGDYIDYSPGNCDVNDCCTVAEFLYPLSNGSEYKTVYSFDAPTTTLSSIGIFDDVQRKVEVRYD